MTIVLFSARHKVMASDSRITAGSTTLVGSARKIVRLRNGALCGTAGEADTRDLEAVLGKSSPGKLTPRAALSQLEQEVCGIIAYPTGMVCRIVVWHDNGWRGELLPLEDANGFYCVGSGADVAYGALEAGATPKKAVEIACSRDSACGLPVQVEPLK